MIDYINSNNFRDISDFVLWDNNYKPFTFDILKKNAIIWCKRDYIFELFKNLQFSGRNYILITGASDYEVGLREFSQKPKCIKKWFAQNVNYKHPDLISIPIGLHPDRDIDEAHLDVSWFINKVNEFKNVPKSKETLYCNWSMHTNPNERLHIIPKLSQNNIKTKWDYPDFTSERKILNTKEFELYKQGKSTIQKVSTVHGYYDYCNEMSRYQFVVSPPGNGIDCHRTWEALYMGSMPIILNSILYDEFTELPIIKVNDWTDVTYELLYSYLNKEYNYEKLYMNYWIKRIINDFNNL